MFKESLILRVLAISFVFLAVPLLVASFMMFQMGYTQAIKEARRELETSATRRTLYLYQIRPFSKAFVRETAYFLDLKNTFPSGPDDSLSEELKKIASAESFSFELMVLGKQTKDFRFPILAASNSALVGTDFFSSISLPHLKGGETVEFLRYSNSLETQKINFFTYLATAISSGDTLLGYLVATADITKDVLEVTRMTEDLHPDYHFALLQKEGIVIDAADPDLVGNYFFPLSPERKLEILSDMQRRGLERLKIAPNPLPVTAEKGTGFFEFVFKGETQMAYYTSPSELGISFLNYSSKQQIFKTAMRGFLLIYNGFGLIILLGAALSYWLSGKIARPLHQLTNQMQKVGQGDLSARFVKMPFGSEINQLGAGFNTTLAALLEQIRRTEDYRVKKEVFLREVEIGYEVQRQLLPEKMPQIPGCEVAAFYLPSTVAGGDFYDFVLKGESKVILSLADTATKGISSCLYALGVRSLLKCYSTLSDDIGYIATQTNHMFCKDTGLSGMFESVLIGSYEGKTRIFSYVRCGKVMGSIRRKGGGIEGLSSSHIALGLKDGEQYVPTSLELHEGDLVVLYTKGLTENFSEEDLHAFLISHQQMQAAELTQALKGLLTKHNRPLEEEATFLSFSVT